MGAGWFTILWGLGLLFLGTILDISRHLAASSTSSTTGDNPDIIFIGQLIGYLGGFLLLSVGLIRWISTVQQLFETRKQPLVETENHLIQSEPDDTESTAIQGLKDELAACRESEQSLHENEQRWNSALEGAGYGVWDWTIQTDEIFLSKQWKAMLGYEEDEISNHLDEWDKRIHPDDHDRVYATIHAHIDGKTPQYVSEHRVRCKDGSYKWILARGKVIEWDSEGKALRIIGTRADISERVALQDDQDEMAATLAVRARELALLHRGATEVLQQATFKEVLQHSLDLVCDYLEWPVGHAYIRSAEDPEKLHPSDIWHLDDDKRFQNFQEITEQTCFHYGSGLPGHVWESGKLEWIEDIYQDKHFIRSALSNELNIQGAIAFPVMVEGQVKAVLEFFTPKQTQPTGNLQDVLTALGCQVGDAIERQQNANELIKAKAKLEELLQKQNDEIHSKELAKRELEINNQQLEELITWRTNELTKANTNLSMEVEGRIEAQKRAEQAQHEAELANQAKSEFLANMSHELRTPMHAILSFSDFGLDKVETATREKLGRYFRHINVSGERLLHLLNELLDLSKLEAGKMELQLQECRPLEVIRLSVEELNSLAKDRSQTIEIHAERGEKPLTADPDRLLQVVRNLLSNALKFSPDGSTVEITLSQPKDQTADTGIRIQVLDRGVGIPEDELEAVFDEFIQSSKTRTGAGGTGLGLAICREIIKLHHGRIYAQNRDGGGAIFTVDLPVLG